MSRYIEVNSAYRDRNLWPLAGQFEIPISQTGRKSRYDALDPVCLSTPNTQWTSNNLDCAGGSSITGVINNSALISSTSEGSTFVVSTASVLQQLEDYYIGLTLANTTGGNISYRKIVAYKYLYFSGGNYYGQFTVNPVFSDSTFVLGNTITITDPTDLTDTSNPLIFVPEGEAQQNAYANCILYNETQKEYRNILDYSDITHILTIDATNPVTGWVVTNNFSIRKELPCFSSIIGNLSTFVTGTFLTPPTNATVGIINNIYMVTTPNNLWICKNSSAPYIWVDLGNVQNFIAITNGSSENDIYKNYYIRILPENGSGSGTYNYNLSSPVNDTTRIVDYYGINKIAKIYPTFITNPIVGQNFEILTFSYDNLNPFTYTGSLVSQQEMVCYEIELLNVIIPNEVMHSGLGGRIAFYPYIYVELSNVSASGAGLKNVIYSNNPNSTKMTFRVPVSDVSYPTSTIFLKIDASGMVQTIKFKPNDNLLFSVKLQDGEIFDTMLDERYSPYPPNPKSQISAAFRLNRL